MQEAEAVAGDEAAFGQDCKAVDCCVDVEARELTLCRHVPQADRFVVRARDEPSVGHHAQGEDRTSMPFETGGLGAGRQVPQPDRSVVRSRGKPPVGQYAQRTHT